MNPSSAVQSLDGVMHVMATFQKLQNICGFAPIGRWSGLEPVWLWYVLPHCTFLNVPIVGGGSNRWVSSWGLRSIDTTWSVMNVKNVCIHGYAIQQSGIELVLCGTQPPTALQVPPLSPQ
jgi:hypothetical protein